MARPGEAFQLFFIWKRIPGRGFLVASLRCLQGIELMVLGRVIFLHMGSHVANPVFPFSRRIEKSHTEFTGRIFNDSLAAVTFLDNRVTPASIKLASFFGHENTIITLS
jgi:hypothetical protein